LGRVGRRRRRAWAGLDRILRLIRALAPTFLFAVPPLEGELGNAALVQMAEPEGCEPVELELGGRGERKVEARLATERPGLSLFCPSMRTSPAMMSARAFSREAAKPRSTSNWSTRTLVEAFMLCAGRQGRLAVKGVPPGCLSPATQRARPDAPVRPWRENAPGRKQREM